MAKTRNTTTGSPDSATDFATGAGQSQGDQGAIAQGKDSAEQAATGIKQQATQRVRSGLETGKSRAAESLGAVAQSLRASRDHLNQQEQTPIGQVADRAAEKVDQLAGFLRETDVREIARRSEQFARREPALFLGGLFAVGLLSARFLKSSAPENEMSQGNWDASRRNAGGYQAGGYAAGGYGVGGYGTSGLAGDRDVTGTASAPGLAPSAGADRGASRVPDTGATMGGAATGGGTNDAFDARSGGTPGNR